METITLLILLMLCASITVYLMLSKPKDRSKDVISRSKQNIKISETIKKGK